MYYVYNTLKKSSSKSFDFIIIFGFLISFSLNIKVKIFPLVQLYGLGVFHKVMGPMWDICICTLTCACVYT
jgi:hypothetical protein